jgi:hypothetical protein
MQHQSTQSHDVSKELVTNIGRFLDGITRVVYATGSDIDYPELQSLRQMCEETTELMGGGYSPELDPPFLSALLLDMSDRLNDIAAEAVRYRRQSVGHSHRDQIRLTPSLDRAPVMDRGLI